MKILLVFFVALVPGNAIAVSFILASDSLEISVGQEIEIRFLLDTAGESVNAVEGEINYPTEILRLNEVRYGGSPVTLWVERPSKGQEGRVPFSGAIPGGFEGVLSPYWEGARPGTLFTMVFTAVREGEGILQVMGAKALLHDGKGTQAAVSAPQLSLRVLGEGKPQVLPPLNDVFPPEAFSLQVARDPTVFEGKYFLVFAAQDKETGIARFEIREELPRWSFRRLFGETILQEGESPYLLSDQRLQSIISVKAVDLAGNERLAELAPRHEPPWWENVLWWGILGVILFGGILLWKVWGKHGAGHLDEI